MTDERNKKIVKALWKKHDELVEGPLEQLQEFVKSCYPYEENPPTEEATWIKALDRQADSINTSEVEFFEELRFERKNDAKTEVTEFPDMMPPNKRVNETYIDDNPKTRFGVTKPAMSNVPPTALIHLMDAMADGARKYGSFNWREKNVSSTIYYDAALRHLMSWFDGEDIDPVSKVHHLGHAMACCAIILDGFATDKVIDNRPVKGRFAEMVIEHTKKE